MPRFTIRAAENHKLEAATHLQSGYSWRMGDPPLYACVPRQNYDVARMVFEVGVSEMGIDGRVPQ